MESGLVFDNKKYINTKSASKLSGYSADYVGQISRERKVLSKRVGRQWYVNPESLIEYKNSLGEIEVARSSETSKTLIKKVNLSNLAKDKITHIGVKAHQTLMSPEFDMVRKIASAALVVLVTFGIVTHKEQTISILKKTSTEISEAPYTIYNDLALVSDMYSSELADTYLDSGNKILGFVSDPKSYVLRASKSFASLPDTLQENFSTDKKKVFSFVSESLEMLSSENYLKGEETANVIQSVYGKFLTFLGVDVPSVYVVQKDKVQFADARETPTPVVQATTTIAMTPKISAPLSSPLAPPPVQTITKVVEKVVPQPYAIGISDADLTGRLNALRTSILSSVNQNFTSLGSGGGAVTNVYQQISQSQKIDTLYNTTISSPTISSPRISNAAFSGTANFGNNVIIVGGLVGIGTSSPAYTLDVNGTGHFSGALTFDSKATLLGTTTLADLMVTGTTTLQNATSTNFYANLGTFSNLAVTGNSTSTFANDISAYGLAAWKYVTSPFFTATSTVATSTISTGGFAVGTNQFLVQQNSGRVGIATTTPWALLSVNPNGLLGNIPEFAIGSSSSTHLVVTTSGNVGVGTSTPISALTLASGQLSLPTGAASTPALAFITDLASGMWLPGTSQLAFSTAGAERARFDANGNFGIATTSPSQKFALSGSAYITGGLGIGISTTTSGVFQTSGDARIGGNLFVDGNSTTIGQSSAGSLIINSVVKSDIIPDQNITRNLGSSALYWNNIYVGNINANNISAASTTIAGTSSKTFTVDSAQSTGDTDDIDIIFFRGTVVPNALLSWKHTNSRFEFNQPLFINDAGGHTGTTTLLVAGESGQTADIFTVASTTNSKYLTVTSNGNVGIGTTTPNNKLDINGNFYTSGTGFFGGTITATSSVNVNGNVTLGSATTTNVTFFNSRIADSLIPTLDNILDLGDPTNWLRFRTGYFGTSVGIGGTATSTGTQLTSSGAYLIDSAATLSLNTTNNQPVTFGTGKLSFTNASSSQLTSTGSAYFATTGGNVGIGTTSPSSRMSITGSGTGTGRGWVFADNNNAEKVTILDNGKVGVGVTSPLSVLDIRGPTITAFSNNTSNQLNVISNSGVSSDYGGQIGLGGTDGVNIRAFAIIAGNKENSTSGNYQGYFAIGTHGGGGIGGGNIAERMRIDSGGKLGLATTSPWGLLSVNPDGFGNGPQFVIGSSTATKFIVDNSGNVGIGTTSPLSKLAVSGGGSFGADYNIAAPSNGLIVEGNVGIGTTSPVSKLSVVGESAFAGGASVGIGYAGTAAPTGGMIIQGNVGIGTTGPVSPLDVLQTTNTWIANFRNSASGANSGITVGNRSASNVGKAIHLSYDQTGDYGLIQPWDYAAASAKNLVLQTQAGNVGIGTTSPWALLSVNAPAGQASFAIGSSTATSFLVDKAGNVGIGTTVPVSKLDVATGNTLTVDTIASHVNTDLNISATPPASGSGTNVYLTAPNGVGGGNQSGGNLFLTSGVQTNNGNTGATYIGSGASASDFTAAKSAMGFVGLDLFSAGGSVTSYIANAQFTTNTSANASFIGFKSSTNSSYTLSAIGTGSTIAKFGGQGAASGSAWDTNPVGMSIITTEAHTASAQGRKIQFDVVANGATANTTAMTIDQSGNVGIGTTTPNNKLDINGNFYTSGTAFFGGAITATSSLKLTGMSALSLLALDSNGTVIATSTPTFGNFNATSTTATSTISTGGFAVGTNQFVVQQNSGNVGIGTTTPSAGSSKLQIDGGNDNNYLTMRNQFTTNYDAGLSLRSSAYDSQVGFLGSSYVGGAYAVQIRNQNSAPIQFFTNSAYSGGWTNERMRIDSTGNVGIASTTPNNKLDVNGNSYISGTAFFGGAITATSTLAVTGAVTFSNNTTLGSATTTNITYFNSRMADSLIPTANNYLDLGDPTNWLTWRTGYFGTSLGIAGTATSTGTQLTSSGAYLIDSAATLSLNTTNNQPVSFGTGKLTFTNASSSQLTSTGSAYFATTGGNVGIGTTVPVSKLDVNGTGNFATSATVPLIIGGSAVGQTLTFKTTTGVGTTDSYSFTGGNNGATTFATLDTTGLSLARTSADLALSLVTTTSGESSITIGGTSANGNQTDPTTFANGGAKLVLYQKDGTNGFTQILSASSNNSTALSGIAFMNENDTTNAGSIAFMTRKVGNVLTRVINIDSALGSILPVTDNSPTLGNTSNRFNSISIGTGISSFAGNLGIATTSPNNKLDVNGNAYISGTSFFGGAITATSTLNVTGLATFVSASTTNIGSTGSAYFATSGGNVGIGTTSPMATFAVSGGLAVTASGGYLTYNPNVEEALYITGRSMMKVDDTGQSGGKVWGWATGGAYGPSEDAFFLRNYTNSANKFTINANGQMYVQTLGNGTGQNPVCYSGATFELTSGNGSNCSVSSIRFKQNVNNTTYGLADVVKLRPVSFEYKPESHIGVGTHIGFIAEEMNVVIPEVVTRDDDGQIKGINYTELTAILARGEQDLASTTAFISNNYPATSGAVLTVSSTGDIAIGTTTAQSKLTVFSNISGGGVASFTDQNATCTIDPTNASLVCSSDNTLKKDVSTLNSSDTLTKLMNLRAVTYHWNGENANNTNHTGFIAQEVEQIFPEMVHTVGGKKAVAYSEMIPILVNSVQAVNLKVDSIDQRLTHLEQLVASSTTATNTPAFSVTDVVAQVMTSVGNWFADAGNNIGNIFANAFHARTEICVDNECLNKDQVRSLLALVASSTPTASAATNPVATSSPVITITGNNPAQITVGTSYADLGAHVQSIAPDGSQVTDALGLQYSVDGSNVTDITLDTSTSTTHTIVYSAVDTWGNWGYATRTVDVLPQ